MRKRFTIAGTVAALAATVLLLGGVLREAAPPDAGASAPTASPVAVATDFVSRRAPGALRDLEQRVRERPRDAESLTALGLAYQQRARETADPGFLSRSENALRRARRVAPRNADVISGLGSLALSRHDFARALVLGRRAVALAPGTARHYGVLGDALAERGRYDEAFRTFDTMASLRPGLAAYSRVAYARELIGDRPGAIAAMRLALDAAAGQPEPTAWTHVQLAKLFFGQGDLEQARGHHRAALAIFPGYVYALQGLAHVEAASGRSAEAIRLARRAADAVPLPEVVITLGDLYRAAGNERAAREQYGLVGAIDRLLAANGVRTDLELALFRVDHGIRLREALALARRAHRGQPSVDGDDVLAWALTRNGRCAEALSYSQQALRLGTRDALKFFHRGMVERCLGRPAAARAWFRRALDLNPHFSVLWAPVARRYAS